MRKVAIVSLKGEYSGYDPYENSYPSFHSMITDWHEVTDEEYKALQHQARMLKKPDMRYFLLEQLQDNEWPEFFATSVKSFQKYNKKLEANRKEYEKEQLEIKKKREAKKALRDKKKFEELKKKFEKGSK